MSESGRPRALGWLSLPSSARKYVILGVICALGAGLAAFLFLETAHTEYSLSEAAFRGTFTSSMSDFAVFMTGQLRAIRAVADSLATHGSLPDFQTTSRVRSPSHFIFKFRLDYTVIKARGVCGEGLAAVSAPLCPFRPVRPTL